MANFLNNLASRALLGLSHQAVSAERVATPQAVTRSGPAISFKGLGPAVSTQRPQTISPAFAAPVPNRRRGLALSLGLVTIMVLAVSLGVIGLTRDAPEGVQSAGPALASAAPERTVAVELFEGIETSELVTRTQAVDLLAMIPATPAVPSVPVASSAVRDPKNLTQAEIARRTAEATQILQGNKLRMLREAVLAGIYRIEAVEESGVRKIKMRTVNAELSQKNLIELLTRAAAEGRIELPPSLSTTSGAVDMDTMLFHLVQASLATDGTSEGTAAALEMTRRAFAAAAKPTTTGTASSTDGTRTYVVEPGDSLAYISLQFYGKPDAYDRIYQANRDILQSPDNIRIGQRLRIPS